MAEKTNLKVDKETRRQLKVYCAENEYTYDEGIRALLDEAGAGES